MGWELEGEKKKRSVQLNGVDLLLAFGEHSGKSQKGKEGPPLLKIADNDKQKTDSINL